MTNLDSTLGVARISAIIETEKARIEARKLDIEKLNINIGSNKSRKVLDIQLAKGYNRTNSKKEILFEITFAPQCNQEHFINKLFLTEAETIKKIEGSEKFLDDLLNRAIELRKKLNITN